MKQGISFVHKDLGNVTVRVNARARHIVMRPQRDGVLVTVPYPLTNEQIMNTLDAYSERLKAKQTKLREEQRYIDLTFRIDTACLKLHFAQGETPGKFFVKRQRGYVEVLCPPEFDYQQDESQAWLHKVVEEQLRIQAQLYLPERLQALSAQHGLPYSQVQVNSSRGRWGSCSNRKHISLSFYLMTLPAHLIDYVLLHELSHTKEMNHGERFWALMDKLTDGKAHALRDEIKGYYTDIFNREETDCDGERDCEETD